MDALTLLLIVDLCNRDHEVTDQYDRPAIHESYTETYPHIVSPAVVDKDSECYTYRKPGWMKI